MKKRLVCLILTVLLVLTTLPSLAAAEGENTEGLSADSTGTTTKEPSQRDNYGYIPVELPGSRAVTEAYRRGDMATYYRLTGEEAKRDTLPTRYDSRDYGYITSVKDQNPYGSCWAHAAMASVESYMIKHEIPVGTGAAATTSLDLSETQHAFFTYTDAYDAEGMLTGDKNASALNCLDQGGNGYLSAYTLMRWTGAASETASALAYSRAGSVAHSGLASKYAYRSNICHMIPEG